jgi:hypothetical protein
MRGRFTNTADGDEISERFLAKLAHGPRACPALPLPDSR